MDTAPFLAGKEPFVLRKLATFPDVAAVAVVPQDKQKSTAFYSYNVRYALKLAPLPVKSTQPPPPVPPQQANLQKLLGLQLTLTGTGDIYCIHCGRKTKKSFNQGYCYVCFTRLARADICAIKPELCHFHKKTCREEPWAQKNCFIPHTLYLALSDKLKVGITRTRHEKERWMDQGAFLAYPLAQAQSRLEIGLAEEYLKKYFQDKTFWRKMLQTIPTQQTLATGQLALQTAAQQAQKHLQTWQYTLPQPFKTSLSLLASPATTHKPTATEEWRPHYFHYPLAKPPPLFHSFSLEKTSQFSGTLLGIKGQYLIFDTGVFNVRKFAGYAITLTIS